MSRSWITSVSRVFPLSQVPPLLQDFLETASPIEIALLGFWFSLAGSGSYELAGVDVDALDPGYNPVVCLACHTRRSHGVSPGLWSGSGGELGVVDGRNGKICPTNGVAMDVVGDGESEINRGICLPALLVLGR